MQEDDHRPRPSGTDHAIGQPLDALSLDDLAARIALLRGEIERLERARAGKQAALEAADSIFKTG